MPRAALALLCLVLLAGPVAAAPPARPVRIGFIGWTGLIVDAFVQGLRELG